VRATTTFNRLLRLQGARVIDVSFAANGVIVEVALRRRRAACSACGQLAPGDPRSLGQTLAPPRPRREPLLHRVPAAARRLPGLRRARRGGPVGQGRRSPHARLRGRGRLPRPADGQEADRRLLRIAWDTVGRIVERVVADHLDERRLEGLVQIGVDEIAYRRGQRYLTSVADHRTGAIVWMKPGRNAATLQAFFACLGERKGSIRAVSIDMSGGYEKAVREGLPGAEVCIDPFHVVALAGRAVDEVRRAEWRERGKSRTAGGKWVKGVRWSLLKAPERQSVAQLAALHEVQQANRGLYRAFLLKEELRALYHLEDPSTAPPGSPGRVARG